MIKFGDSGEPVKRLQEKLKAQGFFSGEVGGNFLNKTLTAVKYFQSTHLDADGNQLLITGIVDDATAWALDNPSGDAQRLGLDPRIPAGLTPQRVSVLARLLGEHNVREVPDGSNDSPEIRKYGGRRKQPWCAAFVTWGWRETGVINFSEYSTSRLWRMAKDNGWFYPANWTNPVAIIPGNALLFQHKDAKGRFTGTGHVTCIVRVDTTGSKFNTVGGNEGNRVSFRVRSINEAECVGTINPFGKDEQPADFERGIVSAKTGANMRTR